MKKLYARLLGSCFFLGLTSAVNAAGTYYTGSYQSLQQPYSQQVAARQNTYYSPSYTTTGYNSNTGYSSYYNSRYATTNNAYNTGVQTSQNTSNASTASSGQQKNDGFYIGAGISHENAMWKFDMNQSGSILHYDNISWNVLDVKAGYGFNLGNTAAKIDAGFRYGMQFGETTMVDDDITNGGFLVTQWCESVDSDGNCVGFIGDQMGHALSVGSSQGGSLMEFNVGFGLTDMFKIGNIKVTPSLGFRYLSYNLTTERNYGLSVDTAACIEVNGEIQCNPAIIIEHSNGTQEILWYVKDDDSDGFWDIASGDAVGINPGGTYYYQQPGVSHSYDTTWAGPYVALDMVYDINDNNAVNGFVELGLPGYTSTGDQPYRFDWQHPKSIEDKAGIGSALHIGLGANWTTAISNSMSLSVGLTYDYYSVSGADANTYLNESYYTDLYNSILNSDAWNGDETAMLDPETGSPTAINIKEIEKECPGWVCSAAGEINSIYKSMGIRVGLQAKF